MAMRFHVGKQEKVIFWDIYIAVDQHSLSQLVSGCHMLMERVWKLSCVMWGYMKVFYFKRAYVHACIRAYVHACIRATCTVSVGEVKAGLFKNHFFIEIL